MSTSTWSTTLLDANDGSGDCILEIPDEILGVLGWREGDTLNIEQDPDDSRRLVIRKVE